MLPLRRVLLDGPGPDTGESGRRGDRVWGVFLPSSFLAAGGPIGVSAFLSRPGVFAADAGVGEEFRAAGTVAGLPSSVRNRAARASWRAFSACSVSVLVGTVESDGLSFGAGDDVFASPLGAAGVLSDAPRTRTLVAGPAGGTEAVALVDLGPAGGGLPSSLFSLFLVWSTGLSLESPDCAEGPAGGADLKDISKMKCLKCDGPERTSLLL
jgi:hypothetical protein